MDRGDMLGRVSRLPEQCRAGWAQGLSWKVPPRFGLLDRLLVLGMGGSAIGADILEGISREAFDRPIAVNRTYRLPPWVDRRTLVLACSYSGNTEETLSAARQALARGAGLLSITSGGKLVAFSRRHRIPLARIPSGWPPRAALGYMTFVPMGLFARLGWISRKPLRLEQTLGQLQHYIETVVGGQVPVRSNPAKRIALALQGTLPILYGASEGWEGVTYRWRTQLEENAKTLAYHHLFPEATHNEVSGWVHPRGLMKRLTALFLKDPAVHPRTLKRIRFTAQVIRQQGAQVLEVEVPGEDRLTRMLRLIALGDFVSVYLGLLYRQDPTPVVRVEALKKYMRRG